MEIGKLAMLNEKMFNHIYRGEYEKVKECLDNGADVNAKDDSGYTPLILAIRQEHIESVKYLIDNGADVNMRDNDNDSPLMFAAHKNYIEIAKYLIENGAAINIKNNYNETALNESARNGYLELTKLLIAKGAEVNPRNYDGNYFTPLIEATSNNQKLKKFISQAKNKEKTLNKQANFEIGM